MINIKNLSFSFPEKDLYNDISFSIENGQHCAFMGTSGSGKSTLVSMIIDQDKYMYDGEIEIDPSVRIGYVKQFYPHDRTNDITTFEYICKDYIDLETKMNTICTEMESGENLEQLLTDYQTVLDQMDAFGGADFQSNIDKKINLANLESIRNIPISKLSGGEFKLIQIIKELLHSPELIIMDEPDVFLDFENLNSLKNLINGHNGMLLVITHNRFLLNNCFNKIIHLENKQLQEFLGNYTEYNFYLLGSKVETQELAIADEEEIERNENLIDKLRFIASYNPEASRGRALNARVKIQERLEERKIQMPFVNIKRPKIEIETDNILEEDFILKVEGLSLGFDTELVKEASFDIKPGEKIAIIGENGTGKTTLLREIYKHQSLNITISENANIAYVSQSQNESLNEENTILNEFFEIGFKKNSEIYSYLENYNFDEEKINKPISTLSGGEKNTIQIAKVAASNANLLILDEPSSHLDTYAQVELEKALKKYNGAILMVSHDYYTVINTADHILIIENQEIRKMSMRKFRKMIYNKYFNKDYLLIEDKKKEMELRIEEALKDHNFTLAKELLDPLEELTTQLTNLI